MDVDALIERINTPMSKEEAMEYYIKTRLGEDKYNSYKNKLQADTKNISEVYIKNKTDSELQTRIDKLVSKEEQNNPRKSKETIEKIKNEINGYYTGMYLNKKETEAIIQNTANQLTETISNNVDGIQQSNVTKIISGSSVSNDLIDKISKTDIAKEITDKIKKVVEKGGEISDALIFIENKVKDTKISEINSQTKELLKNKLNIDLDSVSDNQIQSILNTINNIRNNNPINLDKLDEKSLELLKKYANVTATVSDISNVFNYINDNKFIESQLNGISSEKLEKFTSLVSKTFGGDNSTDKAASILLLAKTCQSGIKNEEQALALLTSFAGATGNNLNISKYLAGAKALSLLAPYANQAPEHILNLVNSIGTGIGKVITHPDKIVKEVSNLLNGKINLNLNYESIIKQAAAITGNSKYVELASKIAEATKAGGSDLSKIALLSEAVGNSKIQGYVKDAKKAEEIIKKYNGIKNGNDIMLAAIDYVGADKIDNLIKSRLPKPVTEVLDMAFDKNFKFQKDKLEKSIQERLQGKMTEQINNLTSRVTGKIMSQLSEINEEVEKAKEYAEMINQVSEMLGQKAFIQTDIMKGWQEEAEKVVQEYEKKLLSTVLAGLSNLVSSIKFNF